MLTRRTMIKGGAVAAAAALGFWPDSKTRKARTTISIKLLSPKPMEIKGRLTSTPSAFSIAALDDDGDAVTAVGFRIQDIQKIVSSPPWKGKRSCMAVVNGEHGHVGAEALKGWRDIRNLVFETKEGMPIWVPLADVRKVL